MKIAHFGNIANVPYLLAWGMKKFYGIESLIFMLRSPDSFSKRIVYGYEARDPYGIDIIYVDNAITSFRRHIDTLRALIREGVNIVHLHGGGVLDSLETKISRARAIFHFHGTDVRKWLAIDMSRKRYYQVDTWRRRYYYGGLASEDKILVSTPNLFKFLSWKDALKKAEYLPNPVDPTFYESKIEDEQEHTIFLPTRHDEESKRTSIAFEAWRVLRKLNPKARLKTIMWGKDFPAFYEEFKDDNRITWLPVLTRMDYLEHLRSSSVVWGQFALGILSLIELEAMAVGKPLVHYWKRDIYDCGVYGQLPPLHSYRSPSSVAYATKDLLEDEEKRRKTGFTLQRWVLKYHSLDRVSQRLYKIYRRIL